MFRKNEKGFTLVELLIVVAIIGILAAIAIPQFTKYKKNAAIAACNADLRNCVSEVASQYAIGKWNSTRDDSDTCVDVVPANRIGATISFDDETNEFTIGDQNPINYNGISIIPGFGSGDTNQDNGTAANCILDPA